MTNQDNPNQANLTVEQLDKATILFNVHAAIHPETFEPLIHMAVYKDDGEGERGDLLGVSLMDVNTSTHMALTILRMNAGSMMTSMAVEYAYELANAGDEAGHVTMNRFLNYLQSGEPDKPSARHWEERDRKGESVEV